MNTLLMWLVITTLLLGEGIIARTHDANEDFVAEENLAEDHEYDDYEESLGLKKQKHEKKHKEKALKRQEAEAKKALKEIEREGMREKQQAKRHEQKEKAQAAQHIRDQKHEEKQKEKELKQQEAQAKKALKEIEREEKLDKQNIKQEQQEEAKHAAQQIRDQKRVEKKNKEHEQRQIMRLQREERKEERKFMRSKEGKQYKAEKLRLSRREQRRSDEESKEHKRLERKSKNMRRKEREQGIIKRCNEHHARLIKHDRSMIDSRRDNVVQAQQNRTAMIQKWRALREVEVERDASAGMYAYLYKQPVWPISAQFFESKHLVNVAFDYQYAVDCYNSTGAGSKSNITQLAFGEQPISFESILLVKKLFDNNLVNEVNINEINNIPGDTQTDRSINFIGRAESYGAHIEVSRYLLGRDLAIGLEIPVLYRRHHLKANIPVIVNRSETSTGTGNLSGEDYVDVFAQTMLKKILLAKGMSEMGGSAAGLSDIAFFVNSQISSIWFDKLVLGLRCQVPTGKKATQRKLWAPELGNGGFTELSFYSGIQMCYQRFFNPHILGTVAFNFPAHVDRRIPQKVTLAANNALAAVINVLNANTGTADAFKQAVQLAAPGSTDPIVVAIKAAVNGQTSKAAARTAGYAAAATNGSLDKTFPQLAFGDRVYQIGQVFSDFDTTANGFGDVASSVNLAKGAEIKLRIGNIIEHLLSRRDFFDMFYDFRCKMKDKAHGLDSETYNLAVLSDHTQELEHRLGCEYSYQQGSDVRWRLGVRYTFAGMNVPKVFELAGALNYTF